MSPLPKPPASRKVIGILGGMGPASTAHFYSQIIHVCQAEYGASQDKDFPPMIINSLPLQEWGTIGFKNVDAARDQIVEGVRLLERSTADFIVIPCNTSHYVFPDMQKSVRIPILNLIELVLDEAGRRNYGKVGVMGTETTARFRVYQSVAERKNISVIAVTEEEQRIITEAIGNAEGGRQSAKDTKLLCQVAEALQARGAEGVILGCTELPIMLQQKDTVAPLIDSSFVLAQAAVRRAYEG